MLVQIPVTITFDHDAKSGAPAQRGFSRTITMRYFTETTDDPAQYTDSYPPRERCTWSTDRDGVLFGALTREIDRAIEQRAEADPDSYAVKERA
jgi:hypothetical protein